MPSRRLVIGGAAQEADQPRAVANSVRRCWIWSAVVRHRRIDNEHDP
jgi:hypothetical protein